MSVTDKFHPKQSRRLTTSLRELARVSSPKIKPSMNRFVKIFVRASSLLLFLKALQPAIFASVDDAQSFALQAAEPYVKQGFQVREDYWGGDLGSGEKKAVRQQLFKGNEYWFWL